jgi:2-polyprenyl-3-methyl-5-hydroxy-6-metoxy-1,4-benzoquinol methylase
MERLLPDQLHHLWQSVEAQELTAEEFTGQQERLTDEYRAIWTGALLLSGHRELRDSLLAEIGHYEGCHDVSELQRRCQQAVAHVRQEWQEQGVNPDDRGAVERFYDVSQAMLYELMWWHTLGEDVSPLAYVTAMRFAQQQGCHQHLDFGSGVGSGAILFARHGFQASLADISSRLLAFSRWRLEQRGLSARYFDLNTSPLPSQAFDFITAMDVFEHLIDPPGTVERLYAALKPGGFLFARIAAEPDEDRPQHIVQDFEPTFERLRSLGFVEVWRDKWLWGHQVFQKT